MSTVNESAADAEAAGVVVGLPETSRSAFRGDQAGVRLRDIDVVMFFARAPSRIRPQSITGSRQFNPLGQDVSPVAQAVLEKIVSSHRRVWEDFSDRYFTARRREVELAKKARDYLPLDAALATLPREATQNAHDRAVISWQSAHEGSPPALGDGDWELFRKRSMARTLMPLVGLYSTVQVGQDIAYVGDGDSQVHGGSSRAVKLDPGLLFWKNEFFFKTVTWALANGLLDDATAEEHVARFEKLIQDHRSFWIARK